MQRIKAYELSLSQRFLMGATQVAGLRVYGITDVERLAERTPTFAVSLEGYRLRRWPRGWVSRVFLCGTVIIMPWR